MMSSDDDDVEPRLKAVENYYFVDDDDDAPVSFDVLPFQFDVAEEALQLFIKENTVEKIEKWTGEDPCSRLTCGHGWCPRRKV